MTARPTPQQALQQWLERRLDPAAVAWLRAAAAALAGGSDRELFSRISLVSRKLGKAPLSLHRDELDAAAALRPGWDPSSWRIDEAARIRLLLATATADGDAGPFVRRLDALCATADVDELVAFYRGLPLYPHPPAHRLRAAEGLRSNIKLVFEAVAHRNPYPAEQLSQDAWNQMVLKALFVGSALDPIVDLDRRANAVLARMLSDYAHERWAAARPINPELWRCVGPFAAGALLGDFERLLERGSAAERAAAVLALSGASDAQAAELLERHARLRDAVAARGIGWSSTADFH